MKLSQQQLSILETPCIVIDVEQAQKNIDAMQKAIDITGCKLRPHIKTHKMPLFAQMQMKAGACGITCAKVSEAEVMADGGIEDIFIAYPMVGNFRIKRAIELAHRVKRLILAVDSIACAQRLSSVAADFNVTLEIRLEIDTGAGRTGVLLDNAVQTAKSILGMKNLNLTGIYTFKSLIYKRQPTDNNALAALEEGEMMADIAGKMRAEGIEIIDISAGSSPTGIEVAKTGLVNEVRPGTYIFKDQLLCSEHVSAREDIAVRYAATVVSTQHQEYAVIDGGSKVFATDIPLNSAPFYYNGFAEVEEMPNLRLSRMNEEHGILTAVNGITGLAVGDILTLIPIHVCTAINQQNTIYLLENGKLTRRRVDARGMTV